MSKKECPLERMEWTETVESDLCNWLDGSTLFELSEKLVKLIEDHGRDCIIDFDWYGYNNDLNIRLLKYQKESDEDFSKRVVDWHKEQAAREEQSRIAKYNYQEKLKKERAEAEAQRKELYLKLKEEFGE